MSEAFKLGPVQRGLGHTLTPVMILFYLLFINLEKQDIIFEKASNTEKCNCSLRSSLSDSTVFATEASGQITT